MKDKEKATQIGYSRGGGFPMRDACIEMAEWKDQQFKEYLEKKLEWARGNRDYSIPNGTQWHDYVVQVEAYKEIINELFKED